jgi:hypothetical protein
MLWRCDLFGLRSGKSKGQTESDTISTTVGGFDYRVVAGVVNAVSKTGHDTCNEAMRLERLGFKDDAWIEWLVGGDE